MEIKPQKRLVESHQIEITCLMSQIKTITGNQTFTCKVFNRCKERRNMYKKAFLIALNAHLKMALQLPNYLTLQPTSITKSWDKIS